MRKAFTISAIAVAATLAMSAPVTAFASDSGATTIATASDAPQPNKSDSDQSAKDARTGRPNKGVQGQGMRSDAGTRSDKAEAPVVSVTSSPKNKAGYAAGETVKFKVSAPSSSKVSASSDALTGISLTQAAKAGDHITYLGTGRVKSGFGIGTARLTATADYGDTGSQGSAAFSVNTGTSPSPAPVPSQASMSLSADGGRPGDKVAVTIKSGNLKGNATVTSGAFTGTVNLERDPLHEGTWHGQATVSGKTRAGYYAVNGYVGTAKIDTVKFGVAADGSDRTDHHNNGTHVHGKDVKPLHPHQYKVPKGSVQTGMAPASSGNGADMDLIGGSALGAAALVGTVALRRRHHG